MRCRSLGVRGRALAMRMHTMDQPYIEIVNDENTVKLVKRNGRGRSKWIITTIIVIPNNDNIQRNMGKVKELLPCPCWMCVRARWWPDRRMCIYMNMQPGNQIHLSRSLIIMKFRHSLAETKWTHYPESKFYWIHASTPNKSFSLLRADFTRTIPFSTHTNPCACILADCFVRVRRIPI